MSTGGPARLVPTASVARRYYLDGKSKVKIAAELGLSQFQIARLLDAVPSLARSLCSHRHTQGRRRRGSADRVKTTRTNPPGMMSLHQPLI